MQSGSALFSRVPSNPRIVMRELVPGPSGATFAFTFVTTDWNSTATEGNGPQFIFDNTTLWVAQSFEEALPMIQRAYTSPRPFESPQYCLDLVFPQEECMSAAALDRWARRVPRPFFEGLQAPSEVRRCRVTVSFAGAVRGAPLPRDRSFCRCCPRCVAGACQCPPAPLLRVTTKTPPLCGNYF